MPRPRELHVASITVLIFYLSYVALYFARFSFYEIVILISLVVLLWGVVIVGLIFMRLLQWRRYGRRKGWREWRPFVILALPLLLLIPCQKQSCVTTLLQQIDFTLYREAREAAIEAIREGELPPDDPAHPNYITLPERYGNLSGNDNKVTVTRGPNHTLTVDFFISNREFDVYTRSFCYTDDPDEMATREHMRQEGSGSYFPMQKFADHWYSGEAKHGYDRP